MFDEQNVNRETDGKFAEKTGSQPTDVVLTARPELDAYWSDVAYAYALDQEERDWLAEHLAAVDQSEWTTATTSRGIVADALRPHAQGAAARADEADANFAAAVDAEVHYGQYQSGEPMMVVEPKTKLDYDYMSTADMGKVTHYVELQPYARAADIPAKYRAAKRIASVIEENAEARQAAYDARYASDVLGGRVQAFER